MANLVISGDSSGSVTLSAPAVSGTTVLTLPTTSGTLIVSGGAQTIEFADGTVSAPSITNSGDTNTGIFFPAADTIAFTEGGVESMRIDASGNVGIGITNPGSYGKFAVNGPIGIASGNSVVFYNGANTNYSQIASVDNSGIAFSTVATERMRIDSSGNVLIGTTTAVGKTTIRNALIDQIALTLTHDNANARNWNFVSGVSGLAHEALEFRAGTNKWITWNDGAGTANYSAFYTSNTERMRIDSSGRVGIGVSSIASSGSRAVLQVANGSSGGMIMLGNGGTENPNPRIFLEGTNDLGFASGVTTGVMKFYTNDTERARIDANGNVLVACTSSPSSTVRGALIGPNGPSGVQLVLGNTVTGVFEGLASFVNGNGTVGRINTSGSSTAYVTSSDYRLKENIAPMTGALATIQALKPVTYKWKVDGSDGQGFIAHELQAVVPECVSGEKDAVNKDGSIKPQGIDTSFLVATLTAAIQEQQAIITQLQADVAALKGAK